MKPILLIKEFETEIKDINMKLDDMSLDVKIKEKVNNSFNQGKSKLSSMIRDRIRNGDHHKVSYYNTKTSVK